MAAFTPVACQTLNLATTIAARAVGAGAGPHAKRCATAIARHIQPVGTVGMLESDYIRAEPPKEPPAVPVRVSRKSQLMAALRQHVRPIVIEDQDLARPFARLLRMRELRLRPLGGLVAETMSYSIRRSYGADVEAHWYIGRYVLPGNVQKVILKPKGLPSLALPDTGTSARSPRYRQ
jgi:hypothetical protein